MRRMILGIVLGCAALSACSSMSYTVISPVYTTDEAFLIDSEPTMLHPRVFAEIWFGGAPYIHGKPAPCIPASVAEFKAHPEDWQGETMQRRCSGHRVTLLPAGTALVVDTAERSWDFENGTRYSLSGHLFDPKLSQHEIILRHAYFVFPGDASRDTSVKPNPAYFTSEALKPPQP